MKTGVVPKGSENEPSGHWQMCKQVFEDFVASPDETMKLKERFVSPEASFAWTEIRLPSAARYTIKCGIEKFSRWLSKARLKPKKATDRYMRDNVGNDFVQLEDGEIDPETALEIGRESAKTLL